MRFGGSGASGRFEGSGRYEGSEDLETFNRPRRHSKSDALDYSVMVHVLVRVDKKCIGLPQKGALEKAGPDSHSTQPHGLQLHGSPRHVCVATEASMGAIVREVAKCPSRQNPKSEIAKLCFGLFLYVSRLNKELFHSTPASYHKVGTKLCSDVIWERVVLLCKTEILRQPSHTIGLSLPRVQVNET